VCAQKKTILIVSKIPQWGVLCDVLKKLRKFCTLFFTYYQSTHSKKQPVKLLRCSDQPFGHNKILKFAKIFFFIFATTRFLAA